MTYKNIIILSILIFISDISRADVTCDSVKCSYVGKVATVYVNTRGQIIVYLDKSYPELLAGAKALGQDTVTSSNAFSVRMFADDGSIDKKRAEVAKLFYATVLSAQATSSEIVMHARTASSGYMIADRIWLK